MKDVQHTVQIGFAAIVMLMMVMVGSQASAEVDASGIWPAPSMTEEAEYMHYTELARTLGHTVGDRPTLLGIRGLELFANRTHPVRSSSLKYDDSFVFIVPKTGTVHTFKGSTHPFMRRSAQAPDLDEDGIGDVAMIRPGKYAVSRMDLERLAVRTLDGSRRIPAYRDFDHDGIFEDDEKMLSMLAKSGPQVAPGIGVFASAILFHAGGGFGSIGCQTTAVVNMKLLHANAPFDYLLVDSANFARDEQLAEAFPTFSNTAPADRFARFEQMHTVTSSSR